MSSGASTAAPLSSLSPSDRHLLLTELMSKYQIGSDSSVSSPELLIRPNKRYLSVRLTGGRAFVDFLLTDESKLNPSTLTVHAQFGSERRDSSSVTAAVEPEFNLRWFFPLQNEQDEAPLISLNSLLDRPIPLSLILLKHSQTRPGEVELLSAHDIEWRKTLVHGRLAVCAELPAFNSGSMEAAQSRKTLGLLNVELEIVPLKYPSNPSQLPVFIEQKLVHNQLKSEQLITQGIEAKFHSYIKS
jgi:hypothetical protein